MFKPLARLPGGSGHKVSIIVAAKNEADTLRECLASLAELEYPDKEVIVVCGPSNDGTEEVAQEFAGKMTVLREPERPPDWLGKSWACHHGYLRSTGDVLLFADGDVIHSPESLGVVLANLDSKKADLLSVWPEMVTRTRSERVIFPTSIFFLCVGVAALRQAHARGEEGQRGQRAIHHDQAGGLRGDRRPRGDQDRHHGGQRHREGQPSAAASRSSTPTGRAT